MLFYLCNLEATPRLRIDLEDVDARTLTRLAMVERCIQVRPDLRPSQT